MPARDGALGIKFMGPQYLNGGRRVQRSYSIWQRVIPLAFIKNLMKRKRDRRLKGELGKPDLIVVGLGNPGPQYESTRHNAGWWLVDLLAKRHSIDVRRAHSTTQIGVGKIGDYTVAARQAANARQRQRRGGEIPLGAIPNDAGPSADCL